jgi:methylenetetrahydrofolate dehydrogenase (NADP+)/methenyltetrahydrofolate cyclohydrolase
MTAQILDGKAIAQDIVETLRQRVDAAPVRPGLAVVLVGDDPASAIYVRNKKLACERAGIVSFAYELPSSTSESELLALIERLNATPEVHGILVQSPLPPQIDFGRVIETIAPEKDVDGFHPYNLGRLAAKLPTLRACTPYGVMKLLERTGVDLVGKDAVVIGASTIVGRPMALELLLARATVTICHSKTVDLEAKLRGADIVVAAVGRAEMIRGAWIKPGAIVIDVGMNRGPDGRLRGDVEYAAAAERAAWITPVPGGVGPMTIAMLLTNAVAAAGL